MSINKKSKKVKVEEFAIDHNYQKEMIVPLGAITRSLSWITMDCEKIVTTKDGSRSALRRRRAVHILSPEGKRLVNELYTMSTISFLNRWYERTSGALDSMFFEYITLDDPA